MNNLSKYEDRLTAHTQSVVAHQRAETLACLNKKNVLELCVGPSLKVLQDAYSKVGVSVTGNDIEQRWKKFYPEGKWLIGDCFNIDWTPFDAIVFAPPLSKGCSGRREDSLMIEQVTPSYYDFLKKLNPRQSACLVLPARCIATKQDRIQYHRLLSYLWNNGFQFQIKEMKDSKQIRKYVDVYISK